MVPFHFAEFQVAEFRFRIPKIVQYDSLQVFSSAKFDIKFKHNFRFTGVLTGLLRVKTLTSMAYAVATTSPIC